jgi:hypothetical protein
VQEVESPILAFIVQHRKALTCFAGLVVPVHGDSTPDLTLESVWVEKASELGQAAGAMQAGEEINIVATVKNIGGTTANGYYIDIYYDDDYGRGGPDNIASGEVQTWCVGPLTAQAGAHTTKWVVDPDDQIAELDETNNVREYGFTVGASPPPQPPMTLVGSPNAVSVTLPVQLKVQVTSAGIAVEAATVTFYVDGAQVGSGVSDLSGYASVVYSASSPGTHSWSANAEAQGYSPANSGTWTFTIQSEPDADRIADRLLCP